MGILVSMYTRTITLTKLSVDDNKVDKNQDRLKYAENKLGINYKTFVLIHGSTYF